jgi:hypothetical protein
MFQAKYGDTDTTYQIPSDDIDPAEKKKPGYMLKWAQAVYQQHVRDQGGIRYTKLQDIDLARQYAEGRQPVEKYLDILCPKDKKTKERRSYMDISTDILSIIPKFRSIVIGKFIQYEHDIMAEAIDEDSGGEKRNARYKLWADSQIQEALKPFKDALEIGIDPQQAEGIIPKTVEELDMLQHAGAFKLKWEAGMEKLLKDAFYSSDWGNIKVKAYEDIFDLGMFATRDYTDKLTGKAKVRYVDPKRLIVRHSNDHLYRNIDYAGEIVDMTPNQIKVDAGEQIPPEQLNEIIRLYRDSNHLDFVFNENINDLYEQYGNMEIKVMDLTIKTIDTSKHERKTDARGNSKFYNKPYDYQLSEEQIAKGNREVLVGKKQMVYKCKWIVGSNYVYDYGLDEDILRDTDKTVKLPFNIYRLSRKSMLDSIIPLEDHIQLNWMKMQNALAKAAPGGIAVDVGALKNITNGKNKLKPLELLSIRRQTGDLLFKSTTHHSQMINPNAGRPIIDLPGGVGAELDEYIKVMDFNINMIRQITGINEMMDATAPPPGTLVGTAEIAEQGTNNTLYNLYNTYKVVKENTASSLSLRIQNIIRYVDYKPYEPVVGSALLGVFRKGSPIAHASYGIKLLLKPSNADKQSIMEKAQFAFQQQPPMISLSDYMRVEQEVKYGSIQMARMFLMYKEDQYKKEQAMINQQNVEAQKQSILEQQDNALKGDMMKMDKETDNNIKERAASAELDVNEYAQKNEYKKSEDDNKSKNKIKENILK